VRELERVVAHPGVADVNKLPPHSSGVDAELRSGLLDVQRFGSVRVLKH
jgi:hypothetical protein